MLRVEVRERLESWRLANSSRWKECGGSPLVAAGVVVGNVNIIAGVVLAIFPN